MLSDLADVTMGAPKESVESVSFLSSVASCVRLEDVTMGAPKGLFLFFASLACCTVAVLFPFTEIDLPGINKTIHSVYFISNSLSGPAERF